MFKRTTNIIMTILLILLCLVYLPLFCAFLVCMLINAKYWTEKIPYQKLMPKRLKQAEKPKPKSPYNEKLRD